MRVSTLLTVPVLPTLAEGELVGAGAEVDRMAVASAVVERDGVGAGAAGDGLDVGDGGGVGEAAEGERVAAGAEVDRGVGDGGAEGDGVGAGAAGDGLDVGDGGGVGAVGEGEGVAAGAEVDGAVGEAVLARVMASAPAPPTRVSTLLSVPVLPPAARVSLSAPAPRSTDMAVVSAVPRVMVSAAGAAGDGLDVGDGGGVGAVAEGERVGRRPPGRWLALAIAPVRAMVSAPAPEMSVSTVLKVAVFAALPRVMMTDTAHLLGRGNQGPAVLSFRLAWLRYCANECNTPQT